MTDRQKNQLRSIMKIAWRFRYDEPSRAFSDCLRGAWHYHKRAAKSAARFMAKVKADGGFIRLSPDLTRSPIRRTLQGQPYEGRKAYAAAYSTAMVGR